MERAKVGALDDRGSNGGPGTGTERRQFLRLLGTGAAAGAGLAGAASAHGSPVVSMDDDQFDPIGLFVEPGTTVRFEIEDGSHSATTYEDRIPADATPFDSGVLSDGAFEHAFETPGTYDYYCRPHRSTGMVGRIVVGEPGGPAEEGPIPDGAVPDSATIVERGTVGVDEFEGDDDGAGGGMMGAGPGMMHGGGPGWMLLVPIGFASVFLALVGGVVYWVTRLGTARRGTADAAAAENAAADSAISTLRRRYARGEIDEAEYRERRARLREGQRGD